MEGMIYVRMTQRQLMHNHVQPMFNIDYHSFMDLEGQLAEFELAMEFGLSLQDVKTLKKKMSRS